MSGRSTDTITALKGRDDPATRWYYPALLRPVGDNMFFARDRYPQLTLGVIDIASLRDDNVR